MPRTSSLLVLVGAIAASCARPHRGPVLVNPVYDHSTADRLTNPYPAREGETPYDALDFLSPKEKVPSRSGEHSGEPGSSDLDPTAGFDPGLLRQAVDWDAIRAPQGVQITWLGHATYLIQIGGVSIVTDPMLTELPLHWLMPDQLRRVTPPVVNASDLRFVDAVLISHDHYDHT